MTFRRMAGSAGLISVALFIASFVSYGTLPDTDATASEVAQYISGSGGFSLGVVFGILAALFMFVYFAGFSAPFRATDVQHNEGYGGVIVGMAVIAAASMGLGSVFFGVLGNRIEEFDGGSLWALWDGGNLAFGLAILTGFFAAGAAAMAIRKHKNMPAWFGNLSALFALTCLGGLFGFFSVDGAAVVGAMVGYFGIFLWILVGSILMLRKS